MRGERKGSTLPLLSFLLFYFRVTDFTDPTISEPGGKESEDSTLKNPPLRKSVSAKSMFKFSMKVENLVALVLAEEMAPIYLACVARLTCTYPNHLFNCSL